MVGHAAIPSIVSAAVLLAGTGCVEPVGGPRLYVTSGFTDEVLILSPASGRILERRDVDLRPGERDEPHGVAVAPDGRHWYVTLAHGEPTLWKYETEGDRLVGRTALPLRGASRVDVSPDGSTAVVADYWLGGLGAPSDVAVVTLETMDVVARIEVCAAPHHAAWSPSGDRIAIACALSDEIVLLDAKTLKRRGRFPVRPPGPGDPVTRPGNPLAQPLNLAWSPDGSRLYVSLMRSDGVAAFTPDGERLWAVRTGDSPAQIALAPDGDLLVVANRGDASVALVDPETGTAHAVVLPDIAHPHGVALSDDGTVAYVTYEGATTTGGGVLALDLREERVLWKAPAGAFTLGVAVLP
jgi:DNA-binding beta-propeller fold protein YncE